MQIELAGAVVALKGNTNPIAEAALAALCANGGKVIDDPETVADIVLISCPLRPGAMAEDPRTTHADARKIAASMAARASGRIVFLMSALGGMPMRRYPRLSMDSASTFAGMRALAMEFGPKVLVNAVGFGLIEDGAAISGDKAMLSHAAVGRAGSVAEAVAAVLFLCDPANSYTTGQMLVVDGGWSAGYGRNF
jgi:NAD(P)-dependent dehydrogenase (short-subunit alcohol dehydrogenase family)